MTYIVRDIRFENRWVEFKDHTVKFVKQMAEVADHHIEYFRVNPDFEILEQTKIDEPQKAKTTKK